MPAPNHIAKHFLNFGIQNWGQTEGQRKQAKDQYLIAAGFNLPAQRGEAEEWLDTVLDKMPWGKFEREVDHLKAALAARIAV